MAEIETVLNDPGGALSAYEKTLIQCVHDHGWQTTSVPGDDDPAFSYTTGFWLTRGTPELIVFDFPPHLAHDVFGQAMRELSSGRELPMGVPLSGILAGEDVFMFPVRPEAATQYLLSSQWFYKQSDFPAAQLVWPDNGYFPWQDGFDGELKGCQPDLSHKGWLAELR
jgi:hypothetical protein